MKMFIMFWCVCDRQLIFIIRCEQERLSRERNVAIMAKLTAVLTICQPTRTNTIKLICWIDALLSVALYDVTLAHSALLLLVFI